MKICFFIVAAALVVWAGYRLAAPEDRTHGTEVTKRSDPPTTVVSDPVEVFQKAFWKRPTADDKILHAERREWADGAGVKRWQWFIAVQPSPELVKHLRTDNAFNLRPGGVVPESKDSPEWFAFDTKVVEVLQAPGGNLRLIFSKVDNLLYATDAGGGFRAGAPEIPKAASTEVAAGRLPITRPPNPLTP